MTSLQSLGHIGGSMDGTRTYAVTIEFLVYADNDDDALYKVTNTLEYGRDDMAWAWKRTQLIKESSK